MIIKITELLKQLHMRILVLEEKSLTGGNNTLTNIQYMLKQNTLLMWKKAK